MNYDSPHQAHAFLYARIKLTLNRAYTKQASLHCSVAKMVHLHFLSDSLTYILTQSLTTYSSYPLNQTELTMEYILSEC